MRMTPGMWLQGLLWGIVFLMVYLMVKEAKAGEPWSLSERVTVGVVVGLILFGGSLVH